MIVRQIRYPRNDNTVEYVINGYTESGEYIDQIIIRDNIVYQRANIKVSREGTIKFEDLIEENNCDNN